MFVVLVMDVQYFHPHFCMYSPFYVDMPMEAVLSVCLVLLITYDLIQILCFCIVFIPASMCSYFSVQN